MVLLPAGHWLSKPLTSTSVWPGPCSRSPGLNSSGPWPFSSLLCSEPSHLSAQPECHLSRKAFPDLLPHPAASLYAHMPTGQHLLVIIYLLNVL